jgi:hypothetical protein
LATEEIDRFPTMASVKDYERSLLECFIASFEHLDEMRADERLDPIAWQLSIGGLDRYGLKSWRPMHATTEVENLGPIYSRLPAKFPHLYESLILSYRWAEVDLQSFTLLANPPGPGVEGLMREISKDPALWNCLRMAGYIQFGKGPDLDYDPVCFDLSSRKKNGRDYRIVKTDHEQILNYGRIKVIKELAPSFEALVRATIEKANLPVPTL